LASAHDVSEGGLAVALAECATSGIGAVVRIEAKGRKDFLVFGEDPSRVLVSYDPARRAEVEAIATRAGAPFTVIGRTGGSRLAIEAAFDRPLDQVLSAWKNGLKDAFGFWAELELQRRSRPEALDPGPAPALRRSSSGGEARVATQGYGVFHPPQGIHARSEPLVRRTARRSESSQRRRPRARAAALRASRKGIR